jgi:uncharacterized membrane protein YdcZ (DUF606 family)
VFVLAIVIVVFCEHFTQLFRELIRLVLIGGVVLAALMVADTKPRSAAIAQLESFNRIGGIFGDFFVKNSNGTVQIVGHIILRWG